MKLFVYVDNSDWPNTKVVFSTPAETITEADELYQQHTGKDVKRQPHIGCQIHRKDDRDPERT